MIDNDESSISSISPIIKQIDETVLIQQVKQRSVLWDLTEDNYRKRVSCDQAWEEVLKCLVRGYECLENDRKTSLTKEVKKKWTNLRDCYNKSRKAGKESGSRFKSLDFLAKVYGEKEKRGSSLVSPSKEKIGLVADPDADTQVNSSLQRRDGVGHGQPDTARGRSLFSQHFSEPARPEDGDNPGNVMGECGSSVDCDDEDSLDVKPQCSTTFTGGEAPQRTARSGVKRRLEENKEVDGDEHFLQCVKTLTRNFNQPQTKKFRSETLQLLESVSNDLDEVEMESFNFEILKFLLSMKNLNKPKIELYQKVMGCVAEAGRSEEGEKPLSWTMY